MIATKTQFWFHESPYPSNSKNTEETPCEYSFPSVVITRLHFKDIQYGDLIIDTRIGKNNYKKEEEGMYELQAYQA